MRDVYTSDYTRVIAAQIAGQSPEMDQVARRVMNNAQRVAAQYVDTSAYVNNFSVHTVPGEKGTGRTVDDRIVVNDDPGAAAQEWGYMRRFKNSEHEHVPGRHIMRKALAMSVT